MQRAMPVTPASDDPWAEVLDITVPMPARLHKDSREGSGGPAPTMTTSVPADGSFRVMHNLTQRNEPREPGGQPPREIVRPSVC